MKKKMTLFIIQILCLSLLLQGIPVAAAGDFGKNEPTHTTKYTVKKIKKPPYCITVNGNEDKDFSTQPWSVGSNTQINIVGQRDDDAIAGEWQFFVTFSYLFAGETDPIEGLTGSLVMGLSAKLNGDAEGNMIDLVEKKKKEKEEKEKEWQPVFPSDTPKPKQTPIHTDPNTIKNSQEAPKELYQCEFDVDMAGTIQNMGSNTVYGELSAGSQSYSVHADFLPEDTNVKGKGKVKIIIDANNNVIAFIEVEGESYGPYAGVFTCEEDLDIQRKDSGTWPIWGVWTDVNPYEPMPNIEKDLDTIAEQIKKGETPKKINYPEGRWVLLKQGKKGEVTTYATLQVSSEDISYESGEIWTYPGSAMFKPYAMTIYSKDLQTVIKTYEPMDYELAITYHTANDTITYPRIGFGTLVRVRDANLLGVWSNNGNLDMPVSGDTDVPAGIWYEFVRGGDDTDDLTQKGFSAAYTFTRIITKNDKSMEIDKGTAVIMPIADNEIVTLTGIKSKKIASDGTITEQDKLKENETIGVSDFNKSEGMIKFNLVDYTAIPGLKIEGSWSNMDPPVGPPDVANGAFLVRDENGDAINPPSDAEWIEFSKEKKTFVWTQMVEEPDGILVKKGSYRTFGEDLLLFTDIKGSFYALPDTDIESFEDKDYMYGEKLFQVEQKLDEEKNPVSLNIAGVGKFKPVEEDEE